MSKYSDKIKIRKDYSVADEATQAAIQDNYYDEQEAKLQRQKEGLYPGELLRTSYEEFMKWYATSPNPSAYEFLNFLLRQSK